MSNLLFSFLIPFMIFFTPIDSTVIDTNPSFDKDNCTCKGIPLYGEVQVVNSNADFTITYVKTQPGIGSKY